VSPSITADVLAAAQAGDGNAFRLIYEDLAPAILGYLSAKGVSDPEAVTSDVFLALLPQLPTITGGPAGLRTLVFSIAHARMVDHHRARGRRPETVEYDPTADVRLSPSAEHTALESMEAASVTKLLAELPQTQREVLMLRLIGDLTVPQVAEVMGTTAGAIKQHQRRGLLALRELLSTRQVTL
jgi:RNA polymerase sigma factor (sigma-70 family)